MFFFFLVVVAKNFLLVAWDFAFLCACFEYVPQGMRDDLRRILRTGIYRAKSTGYNAAKRFFSVYVPYSTYHTAQSSLQYSTARCVKVYDILISPIKPPEV